MTTTMTKIGRTTLAVLLAAFVCLTPAGLSAFADEEPATTEAGASTATADADQVDATATADGAVADAATAAPTADTASATQDAATATAEAPAADAATTADDAHTLNVGTFMELHDVFKYDINAQSNETFVINLTDDITLEAPLTKYRDEAAHTWVFTTDTHGKRYTTGTDALRVKNGNTVTLLGHGHSLIFDNNTVNNITPGTIGSNLILGAADGSDSLTLNYDDSNGSGHQLGSLVDATGGTLTIHEGVTLSNNVNFTAYPGGGISATNGAVVNMDGGLIENCSNANITWGGGISVDGSTFNMTGGTIRGNSEKAANEYPGFGGGVSLAAHGNATTFNMSGDAVIEGNNAPYGGGVYVGKNGTFTMSGNAAVLNNTAEVYGGGVYVAQGGTFAMGEGNVVKGNSAAHGGGVMNFGTATITNVYDNDATASGADIYNGGNVGAVLTMEPVKADWSLAKEQATSAPSGQGSASSDTPTDTPSDLPGINFQSDAVPATTVSAIAHPLSYTGDGDAPAAATAATAAATVSNPSNKTIDGWYYDGHRETGETDANGNAVVDHSRWNANEDTADAPQYLQSYVATGTPTTETMGLKAAHGAVTTPDEPTPATVNVFWENDDGSVLFELEKVEVGHVPEASEYNALSGKDDPTEATSADDYEFEGWKRSVEPNGDVIYMAQYEPETQDTPADPTPTPTDPSKPAPTPRTVHTPQPITDTTQPASSEAATLQQTGDEAIVGAFIFGGVALIAIGGVAIARRKALTD